MVLLVVDVIDGNLCSCSETGGKFSDGSRDSVQKGYIDYRRRVSTLTLGHGDPRKGNRGNNHNSD